MLAYKTKLNISNDTFLLKVPSNFKGKNVEIIILEVQELNENFLVDSLIDICNNSNSANIEPNEFQKILLNSPTWSENEYQNFLEIRKLFN